MPQLSQLLARLPEGKDVHMSTMGHVLWVCWQGNLPQAVNQTLLNYGGMLVGEDRGQAIWFFFTDDAFLAVARLMVWGHINSLPYSIELFPGRLQLGSKREVSLMVDGVLMAQEMLPGDSLDVWIHPKSREGRNALPGITFERARPRQGMAQTDWAVPQVDVRMPYASTQAWFAVLHPLGSPLDKSYREGWSKMFKRIEALLQQLKMRFIVHESFVIISIDNLLMLRTFMREYLRAFDKENEDPGASLPCVCVVADRQNFNFNNDLPKKVSLQWDNLMPDVPYISYRNAYLLGDGFTMRDLRFSGESNSLDSWCNVLLDDAAIGQRSIPLIMSAQLAGGKTQNGCFYCGLHNHEPCECPTRAFFPSSPDTWTKLAALDLDAINESFRQIELVLDGQGMAGFASLLEEQTPAGLLMRAVLDLNAQSQLRNVPRNWLYRMREQEQAEEKPAKDDSPAWDLLEKFVKSAPEDLPELEKEIQQIIVRHPRDPRLRMVRGFLHVERSDFNQAAGDFREAASLTLSPALQAWNEYLQGRIYEEQAQYPAAIRQYAQIWRVMPQWHEVQYRGIVCRVKMGFAEQVLGEISGLVREDPSYFNRILIDPALERGRLMILSSLYEIWEEARTSAEAEKARVLGMEKKLADWFPEDHPVQLQLGRKIHNLQELSQINNYMAFLGVVEQRPQLEKELDESIQREVEVLRNRYKYYLDVLQEIRDEASWFPFPSALRDFSTDFNECAGIINWAFACNFNDAEVFKRAQATTPRLDELLVNLKKRLHFLRSVRDATLFGLTMLKTFIWVEITGLLLCFTAVPAIVFFGDSMHLGWLKQILGENQWSIQKVLVIIVSIIALGLAALRTTLVFDRKREKLLEQAREQREKAQQTRLERVRKQRQAEQRKNQRMQALAQERELRRQMKERA